MNVLHLASFDRWTGAAAPAFAETEALRQAGIEAFYAFNAGGSLEEKVGALDFTYPALHRGQTPRAVLRSVAAVKKLIEKLSIDVVHSHLSHDHWLGYIACRPFPGVRLARTFHSRRAVRSDLLSRHLLRETARLAVVNPSIADHRVLEGLEPLITPPPAEPHYQPGDQDMRSTYEIEPSQKVIGFIGKMTHYRGFQDALRTFSLISGEIENAKMLVIGRGPYRGELEKLALELGIADDLIWAGYHEELLPQHYRTMDAMLFTVPGSDEGHRAVIEAMSCGTPVVSWPVSGIDFVLGDLHEYRAESPTHESLASRAIELFSSEPETLARRIARNAQRFSYPETASRLQHMYQSLLSEPV